MNKDIKLIKRAPIITVAGHIDHGKTTFLNFISKTKNPQKEYGGITQHIKSYYINTPFGAMTFLDTPGHFAFNSNRENCIKVSDIVLLIISIDDGIKPQTIESINLAKKFNIPIFVAINKIDKIENFVEKEEHILKDLLTYELTAEKWGGNLTVSLISSKTGVGVNDLLELLSFQADLLDLKVDNLSDHYGIILENKLDIGKGNVATIILKNGELKKGSIIKVNNTISKIKTIYDVNDNIIDFVYPSLPVNVTGLHFNLEIGEKFEIILDKGIKIKNVLQSSNLNKSADIYNVDSLLYDMKKNLNTKINLIIKVDVQGSIKVLKSLLEGLSTETVKIVIIKIDIGNFNESDLDLGSITNSLLIGFNVKVDSKIIKMAASNSLSIYNFNVIYDIIDFLKDRIKNQIILDLKTNLLGNAEIKKIFKHKDSVIAGCFVINGKIKQNSNIKIKRQELVVYEGVLDSIKVFKVNVKEVKSGTECGIIIKKYNKFLVGDIIEAY